MDTKTMMESAMKVVKMPEIEEYIELHTWTKLFESSVWFPHLQVQVQEEQNARGMEGEVKGIRVMTWVCAGRCMIQFNRGESSLCLITADDEKPWGRADYHQWPHMGPMGIQSVDGEYSEVMKMIYEATRYGSLIRLVANNDVTIGL